jgi:molecular chaperone HtpG
MSNDISAKVQEFEFKAEMKQLLNIIIHSLYTHPEVFLRELVSNASDALNKVRFLRLTNSDILEPESELKITITTDKDKKSFSIEDSGIGMTREELINLIGTVASSGTLKFLSEMKNQNKTIDGQMIGQFGVGFYSVYMVTDEITIETRNADKNSNGYRWKSKGESSYTIEEIDKSTRGTKIYFTLKEGSEEFADEWRVKQILKKYSNFVDFPIFIGAEEANKVQALWHKKKDDIKTEELDEFYKFISNDYQEPLGNLQLAIEGNINFKSILFIPKVAPPNLFMDTKEKSVHLYSSKIFITDDASQLIPEYMRFLKGVVDSEDLPLNVSREVTQNSPLMTKIKTVITGKVLGMLDEWSQNEKEKYNTFFEQFGSLFKTGLTSDYAHKDKIIELILFDSSKIETGKKTSLNGYVSRLKPDQKEIYYVAGNYRDMVERNPNLEYFKKNDIEVLYLLDPVDLFTIPYIGEYDGKKLVSIEKAELKIDKKNDDKSEKLNKDLSKSLINIFKETLGDKVEDVIESERLVSSPATLVVGKDGLDPQMEKMMRMMDKEFTSSKRILEINTSHHLIKNLSTLNLKSSSDPLLRTCIMQIYEGAMLNEGYLNNPSEFISRMTEIMTSATG